MRFSKMFYLIIFLLTGCVSHGQVSTLAKVVDADNAATLTIIREWKFVQGGAGIKVFFDGQNIADLKNGSHIVFKVDPGSHSIDVKMWRIFLGEDLLASTDLNCRAKEHYFIKFGFNSWGPKIELISQMEALELVSKTDYLPLEQ